MSNALLLLIESVVVGFIMAAPVGPIGVLCIRRTLRFGWITGLVTGLSVAVADSFYGAVASLGLTSVSGLLVERGQAIRVVGGLILLVIGYRIFRAPAAEPRVDDDGTGKLWRNFFSALVLAFTNPLTVLSFAAVYIGLGFGDLTAGSRGLQSLFVCGIFFGSTLWWIVLSLGTLQLRKRITPDSMVWINRGCGGAIVVFGLISLASFLV